MKHLLYKKIKNKLIKKEWDGSATPVGGWPSMTVVGRPSLAHPVLSTAVVHLFDHGFVRADPSSL